MNPHPAAAWETKGQEFSGDEDVADEGWADACARVFARESTSGTATRASRVHAVNCGQNRGIRRAVSDEPIADRRLGGCAGTPGTVVLPVAASSSQSPGSPFSSWIPREAKSRPEPAARSLTVLDCLVVDDRRAVRRGIERPWFHARSKAG